MTDLNDREYYARRAARATKLAETVHDPGIAAIHRRMAASYRELAELSPEGQRPLHIVKD